MFLDTRPAPIDAAHGDAYADFRVAAPAEVHGLLRRLVDGAVPVNISASNGSSYTTTLWTVDAARAKLSFSADARSPHVQQLLDADEAVAVAYLDSVKIQFDLLSLVLVRGARDSALQADLPGHVYRFQRRESLRVRTLARTSPTAHLEHPSLPGTQLALRVLDVSMGGCALVLPADTPAPPLSVRIPQVRIELDAQTRFEATLRVQHVTGFGSGPGVRLGCRMTDLAADAQRGLQRYIDQTLKETPGRPKFP